MISWGEGVGGGIGKAKIFSLFFIFFVRNTPSEGYYYTYGMMLDSNLLGSYTGQTRTGSFYLPSFYKPFEISATLIQ